MLINRIHRRKRIFCLTTVLEPQTLSGICQIFILPRQQLQSEAIIVDSATAFTVLRSVRNESVRFLSVLVIFHPITFLRSDNWACFHLVAEREKCFIDAINSSCSN